MTDLTAYTDSDLTETVQDIVGAFLVAGTNVTVTYIGAAMVAGPGVQITVNDAGDHHLKEPTP